MCSFRVTGKSYFNNFLNYEMYIIARNTLSKVLTQYSRIKSRYVVEIRLDLISNQV
jgi:hypothetical protein